MADASRFPRLALPFAVVGAAAGWLSAGLLSNPLVGFPVSRPFTAGVAMTAAALAGLVIKRLCVGRRYSYEMGDPDPEARPGTDRAIFHALVVIAAGGLTGLVIGALTPRYASWVELCGLNGMLCALAFVPVCLAVVSAARRAQRARMGSIVADADARAVWGILAATLAVTTLESIPDWPAARWERSRAPVEAVLAILASMAIIARILRADRRALADARGVVSSGLTPDEGAGEEAAGAARLDLGLGEARFAQVKHGAAAYRDRARTTALVRGDPDAALKALERSARRGVISLALLGAVLATQALALTDTAARWYHTARCGTYRYGPCAPDALQAIRSIDALNGG